jgi:hypothetical protein
MGMLEAPKDAKQLGAGATAAASSKEPAKEVSMGSLSAEDLKELEDLDLSEIDKEPSKDAKKA